MRLNSKYSFAKVVLHFEFYKKYTFRIKKFKHKSNLSKIRFDECSNVEPAAIYTTYEIIILFFPFNFLEEKIKHYEQKYCILDYGQSKNEYKENGEEAILPLHS